MLIVSINETKFSIIILIGGRSRRFGSDKGIFEFLGKPLLLHQLETLSQFERKIYLVAHSKSQVELYQKKIKITKNYPFILDDEELIYEEKVRTPMLGLYSALKVLLDQGYEKAFTLSCDMPLIKKNVIEFLIEQSHGYDCCIPQWNSGFIEPLCAVYPIKEALHQIKINLERKQYKLSNLLDMNWKINYVSIENSIKIFDDKLITFTNINKLNDIKKLTEIYNSQAKIL